MNTLSRYARSGFAFAILIAIALLVLSPTRLASIWTFDRVCDADHGLSVEILSTEPLMLYLNDFLSENEIGYILSWARDAEWEDSAVYQSNTSSIKINTDRRTSQSLSLPAKDPMNECLTTRVKRLLGNLQHIDIEPIQLVKYETSDRFKMHYDWNAEPRHVVYSSDPEALPQPSRRLLSIFAYLDDACTGGETYFPDLIGMHAEADGTKFSRTDSERGLIVKPRRGNAILWMNSHMNGTGDERVIHAGLPVTSGTKIGMNIFTVNYLEQPIVGTYRG